MKYFLALDQKRSKLEDKSDRYKIIDLEKITGIKINSIDGISNYTGLYENETKLYEFLVINGYLNKEDITKHFCICYKSPKKNGTDGKWTKCGKTINGQSDVLFMNENKIFNPIALSTYLLDMQINDITFKGYDNLKENEKVNLAILKMMAKEILTNNFYKYDDLNESAYGLLNYVNNIKNYNYVDNKYYYRYISLLVEHLSYKYNKFDVDKISPLKNKDGALYINKRHLFELVIFITHIQREFNKKVKKEILTFEENNQLTFF